MVAEPLTAIVHKSSVRCIIHTADGIMTSTQFGTVRFWPLLDLESMFQIVHHTRMRDAHGVDPKY